jgi:hypothetical protein
LATNLVDLVRAGIDLAGQTVAAVAITLDLYSPIRRFDWEFGTTIGELGVPTNLDKGVASAVLVSTTHVGGPVSLRLGGSPPDTAVLGRHTRRINVEMSSRLTPVVGAWDSNDVPAIDKGGNQHGFVSRKDSLTDGAALSSVVLDADVAYALYAVWLVWERLGHGTIVVAV